MAYYQPHKSLRTLPLSSFLVSIVANYSNLVPRVFSLSNMEAAGESPLSCRRHTGKREDPEDVVGITFVATGKIFFKKHGTLSLTASRAQVTSLLAVDKELYIGTSWGCILVCNNLSLMVYTVIRCHDETVKHLLPLVTTPAAKSLVLSCGRGYRSLGSSLYGHTSYPSRRSGKTSLKSESAILVWLADGWES